jgi:MFS family permease
MLFKKVRANSYRSKFRRPLDLFSRLYAKKPGDSRPRGRLALLATERNFLVFYAGYTTSLFGTAMSRIALTFAVLDSGGTVTELGLVFAASVFPQVLVMLGGGVLADRVGRRPVMLTTDSVRLVVQGSLAAALFTGKPSLWLFMLLSGLLSLAEGFFNPALSGLATEILPAGKLPEGNAMLGVAQSAATVAGPTLAGLMIAFSSPAVAISLDAASYGASVLALALLRIPPASRPVQSPWRDLADSLAVFSSRTWLWVTTAQYSLFNLFTWAPYLLLGPILAARYMGGAAAWGAISASFAAGSILGGFGVAGRRPRRPLIPAVIGTFGYPLPCLMLALRAPVYAVAAGALVAGCGSAVNGALSSSVRQQLVPKQMLARISAITLTGSYSLGSIAWALIGPLSKAIGPTPLLAFAAAYGVLSSTVVLSLPAVRSLTWQQPQQPPPTEPETSAHPPVHDPPPDQHHE